MQKVKTYSVITFEGFEYETLSFYKIKINENIIYIIPGYRIVSLNWL